jgi:hypothetical protein
MRVTLIRLKDSTDSLAVAALLVVRIQQNVEPCCESIRLAKSPHEGIHALIPGSSRRCLAHSLYDLSSSDTGRYAAVPLVRVDGTWPPHERREKAWLVTVEDRVLLQAGDSYFLPSDMIHDVEMDLSVSLGKPAITLMLTAESTVWADVYLEQPMLEFHDAHPDLRNADCEMPFSNWSMILRETAAYLRGADTVRLPSAPIADSFLVQ